MRPFLIASVLCLASTAQAVPLLIEQQGRLLDSSNQPITGTQTLDFSLWDRAVGGNLLWTETHEMSFDNGYFSAILGADNPLDDIFLATDEAFLELTVEGEGLSPRQRVVSAPYAIVAGTAQSVVGGVVDATSISVGGNPIVDSTGEWVGTPPPDTLSGLTCNTGDVPQKTVAGWVCVAGSSLGTTLTETDVDSMVSNNGYALAAALSDTNPATTPVSWSDITNRPAGLDDGDDVGAGDISAVLTAADSGLSGGATEGEVALSLMPCTADQILENAGGSWACSPRYPAGAVIQVVNAQTTSEISGTSTIPWDDTVPQSTEGVAVASVTITPRRATSQLLIAATVHAVEHVNTGNRIIVAVFRNNAADAEAAAVEESFEGYDYDNGLLTTVNLHQAVPAGSTSALTFHLRAGLDTGRIDINTTPGGRRLGGILASGITVTEIAQ